MRFVKITGPDLCNGVGNRCTLWVAGCTHNCPNCHNKWLQDYSKGKPLDSCKDKLTSLLNLPPSHLMAMAGELLDIPSRCAAPWCWKSMAWLRIFPAWVMDRLMLVRMLYTLRELASSAYRISWSML